MRTHQLETTLRSLALSGMLDTLEARLAQANAGELGHVEFLQMLCEDELARRDAASIARRVRAARFEQTCAMEDFDFLFNPTIPRCTHQGPGHLAVRRCRRICRAPWTCRCGQDHDRPGPWPSGVSSGLLRCIHQSQSSPCGSGRRTRGSHMGDTAPALGTTSDSRG
jgi:hypothetical protein